MSTRKYSTRPARTFTPDFADSPFRPAYDRDAKSYLVAEADDISRDVEWCATYQAAYESAAALNLEHAAAVADSALDLAEQLVAELNQLQPQMDAAWGERETYGRPELHARLSAAYDATSARIRAMGYEVGPDGAGGLCLWGADNVGPLADGEAAAWDAYGCPEGSPVLTGRAA